MKRVEEEAEAKPKAKRVRYFDIHEGDEFDEAQMASWVKQATALPGFLEPRP
jgi:hypothetical protein